MDNNKLLAVIFGAATVCIVAAAVTYNSVIMSRPSPADCIGSQKNFFGEYSVGRNGKEYFEGTAYLPYNSSPDDSEPEYKIRLTKHSSNLWVPLHYQDYSLSNIPEQSRYRCEF